MTQRQGHGDPATELVAACADADLLVVGSRGRSSLAGLLLGSVSRACLAHAPCPVVVVRSEPKQALSHRRVIVGVDGSDHSRQALRLAAEEARLRDAALNVVHAVFWENIGTELLTPTREQLVKWDANSSPPNSSRPGWRAGASLCTGAHPRCWCATARMPTCCCWGHAGVTRWQARLGSTSEHCARYVHCPVMITHSEGSTAGEDAQALPQGTTR